MSDPKTQELIDAAFASTQGETTPAWRAVADKLKRADELIKAHDKEMRGIGACHREQMDMAKAHAARFGISLFEGPPAPPIQADGVFMVGGHCSHYHLGDHPTREPPTLRTCKCGGEMYDFRQNGGELECLLCALDETATGCEALGRDNTYTLFAKILGCPTDIHARVKAHAEQIAEERDGLKVKVEALQLALTQPGQYANKLSALKSLANALAQTSAVAEILGAGVGVTLENHVAKANIEAD